MRAATLIAMQRFDGDRRIGHRHGVSGTLVLSFEGIVGRGQRRRIGHHATQANEKIQRGVQHQAEVVGQDAMATQTVALQFGLQFLVAVLTLAAFGGILVERAASPVCANCSTAR